MYTRMAQNSYAHDKIRKVLQGRDHFQQLDHHTHRQHAWLGTWKDLNKSDIKIFIAHLLIMSSIKKSALHNYWSTDSLTRTPIFGTYLSRNKFQDILWNFQVANAKNNALPGSPNHDPLAKICPLLEMCQMNFCLWYTPSEYISLDESTMAFKGRVKFLQFNPLKPNKFHIKLFVVSEHLSGYISGFLVYTAKTANKLVAKKATLDPYCSVTTKTVMGLLQKTKLLDNHQTVFLTTTSTLVNCWKKCCTGTHMVQVSKKSSIHVPLFTIYWNKCLFIKNSCIPKFFYFEQEIPLFILEMARGNWKGLPQAVLGKQVKLKRGEKCCHQYTKQLKLEWKSTILGNLY